MLKIEYTNKMVRDIKRMKKRGKPIYKLIETLKLLAKNDVTIPESYRDHKLTGEYTGFRECHIEFDWLLIYKISENKLILFASGTGTHDDLFS